MAKEVEKRTHDATLAEKVEQNDHITLGIPVVLSVSGEVLYLSGVMEVHRPVLSVLQKRDLRRSLEP